MAAAASFRLDVDHVTKRYPNGLLALDNVSLAFLGHEIYALLGENGAGKSTLMNILYGVHEPTEGGVLIDGRQVVHRKPADAIASGIGMVHQHFKLIRTFTVQENLALVARGARRAAFRKAEGVQRFMRDYGVDIDPATVVAQLPLALQQRIEILKAVVHETRVLLLDEPSTILPPAEVEGLYAMLRRIRDAGTAVVVVTHNVDEVLRHADRFSVLRRGRMAGTGRPLESSAAELVERIVGRSLATGHRIGAVRRPGVQRLQVQGATIHAKSGSPGLQGVDLRLFAGEVVGVAGVEGNGQTELFELLAGQCVPDACRVERHDGAGAPALVPQDRHHEGLSLDLPVSQNLLYGRIMRGEFRRAGLLDHSAIARAADSLIACSDIRTQSHATLARSLSGGNQQKIVLARALAENAKALVAYQPTRGLDVAAAEAVLHRLAAAANAGTAVMVISSNIEELSRVSDRIVVMNRGRITGELAGERMAAGEIGSLMTSSGHAASPATGHPCRTH